MQVERFLQMDSFGKKTVKNSGGRVSNAWVIYLLNGDNSPKGELIPDELF